MNYKLSFLGTIIFFVTILVAGCHDPAKIHEQLEAARELKFDFRYRQAIPILTSLIESEDSLAAALSERAACFSMLEVYDSAKVDYLRVLAMDEADCKQKFSATNNLSNDFMLAEKWDSCIAYHRMGIEYLRQCRPDGIAYSFSAMSFHYRRKHEYALALSMVDSAKHYGSTAYDDACDRSIVYSDMNQLDSALKYATIALERQSEFKGMILPGWHYYDRGGIYARRGDLTAACADWQKAFELGYKDAKPKLDSFCLKK